MPRDWDEHYRDPSNLEVTPAPLVVEAAGHLAPGHALDLACGVGRNALYLASLGWKVTAVDSSAVGIGLLAERGKGLDIDARVADLEAGQFPIAPGAYDLICDILYLQRNLFGPIRDGVRPGGVFAGAILLVDDTPRLPPRSPDFLLRPGELRQEFAGWKILFESEAREAGRSRRLARILAKKPEQRASD